MQVLGTNVKVEVLDELDGCFLVKWNDVTGYMKTDDISKYYIQSGGGGGGSSRSTGTGSIEYDAYQALGTGMPSIDVLHGLIDAGASAVEARTAVEKAQKMLKATK